MQDGVEAEGVGRYLVAHAQHRDLVGGVQPVEEAAHPLRSAAEPVEVDAQHEDADARSCVATVERRRVDRELRPRKGREEFDEQRDVPAP